MKTRRTEWGHDYAPALVVNSLTASGTGHELDQLLARVLNTPNTTLYDRAIDSAYLQAGVGGSHLHHLVDGQHDLAGAFTAARNAVPGDSTAADVLGTARHLAKDLFSVMGLPVVSVDPRTYSTSADWIQQHLGISKSWQADLLQVNGMELLGGALSAAAVVFGAHRADAQTLAEIAGSSGLAGTLAVNPLSIIAAAVALVLAWHLHVKRESWDPLGKRLVIGAAASAAGIATGTLLGGFAGMGAFPLALAIILSLVTGIVVRQFLLRHAGLAPVLQSAPATANQAWQTHFDRKIRTFRDELDETAQAILRQALGSCAVA